MIKSISSHRSIRKYKADTISEDIMNDVLLAASRASTTGNMQVYSIVKTTNPEIKNKLWECHFKQDMVKEAPVVLTFCADFNRFNQWCLVSGAEPGYDNFLSFMTAAIDALLAAQNACLQAESYGLGICYLGTTTYMAGKIIEVLELPKGVVPVTTVVMGYPDETPGLTDRLPMEAIVHNEKYVNYSEESVKKLYQSKDNDPFYQSIVAENETNSLAQVFTDKRYKKSDNVFFSNELLKILQQQGFMNNGM